MPTASQSGADFLGGLVFPRAAKQIDFLLPPESAGGCFFPVELLVLEPIERAIQPGLRNRHIQLGVTDDDPREGEPCVLHPTLRAGW